jgi:hypothetical protein
VLTRRVRTGRSQVERLFFLPVFRLTQADCRTSRPTMASVSHSSRCMVSTCEAASSAPPATCPQPMGKRGARGNPNATTSEYLGADEVSPTMAFWDGLESGPLEDPKVKAAQPDAPTDQGLASFAQPRLARGHTLAPVARIKADVSIMFPHTGTSGTVPSSRATLEASNRTVSLKDEGVGGSDRATY